MLKSLTAVELFCGCGGLSEGFRKAGFRILAGNDVNATAGRTFSAAHPEAKFLEGPIQEYTTGDFLMAANLKPGELDCLIGGPPCQGFSVNNHKRGLHDERSSLYREYLRVVRGLKPRWVVLENVTGMASAGGGAAIEEILRGLIELGYAVQFKTLKAEEYGVPQERRRIVFIGTNTGAKIEFPNHSYGAGRMPYVTIREAIGDLPPLANGEDKGVLPYPVKASCHYQRIMRGRLKNVHNHAAACLSQINLERMKHIPEGGSWRDIPHNLLPKGMQKARRCDHTKRYGRLRWDGLASTILTKCDLHWGAFIHPEQDRTLTVREAARLQSFPDSFRFYGSRTEQFMQVGNAVPPELAKYIARAIIEADSVNRPLLKETA